MPRNYLETHPWISFSVDTRQAEIATWLLLGEAQSKCEHVAGVLLDPATADELHIVYLAKGALATTAIEGNTLTEDQVKLHLAGKLELPKSKEYLKKEVDNIIKACNAIAQEHLHGETPPLTIDEIKRYNTLVLSDLPKEDDVVPGEMRQHSVTVGRYRGAPAEDCLYLLDRLCKMLEGDFSLGSAWPIASGILKAILAHLYIAWIHPFGDGNGRTARLVEFKLCISAGVPTPAAHLLSNHYNETRTAYYSALDQTSKNKTPFPFIAYALQGYVDQLGEQIAKIRQVQHKAFWTNFIHLQFQGLDGTTHKRRRDLILDLSKRTFGNTEWVAMSDISGISGRLRTMYFGMTPKAISRDVNALVNMGLLRHTRGKVRPSFEVIEAYLPSQVKQE
jgi:Fic family protein